MGDMSCPGRASPDCRAKNPERYDSFDILSDEDGACESAGIRCNCVMFPDYHSMSCQEVRQGLKEYSNWPTYPQADVIRCLLCWAGFLHARVKVYAGGKLVGGLDILKAAKSRAESLRCRSQSRLVRSQNIAPGTR